MSGIAPSRSSPVRQRPRLARHTHDSLVAAASFQTGQPNTERIAETVASAWQIRIQDSTIIIALTTGLMCAIQLAARSFDQVMHREIEEGFDIRTLRYATGPAAILPLTAEEPTVVGESTTGVARRLGAIERGN